MGQGEHAAGAVIGRPPEASASGLTLTVKGMMCPNCERHVREALEALPGIESAQPDFHTGLVAVRGAADAKAIKAAVKAAGYKVQKITETG